MKFTTVLLLPAATGACFNEWRATHGVEYDTAAEASLREEIYNSNVLAVERMNSDVQVGQKRRGGRW